MTGEAARGALRRAGEAQGIQLSFDDLSAAVEDITFVVVDLETTGMKPSRNSIVEIGAVKARGGDILGEFSELVDPGQPLAPFITSLTGITTAMVHGRARIGEVLPRFLEFVGSGENTVLVAHNARFDVSHLKAACAALNRPFPRVRVLDTVRLARRAISKGEVRNHKLATLAAHIGSETTPNHRALDDARATLDLLHVCLARLAPLGLTHLDDLMSAVAPVPSARRAKAHLADGLPACPGVYRFYDARGRVLYVGTSVNVRTRVRQYFTASETRRRIGEMVDLAVKVEATATPTRLEASVLELRQIAELDPVYNRRSKHPERRPWLALTGEPHPRLVVTTALSLDGACNALGPFPSRKSARLAAQVLADWAHVRTCTLRLPRVPKPDAAACHLAELGRCSAPCLPEGSRPKGALSPVASVERAQAVLAGDITKLWEASLERLGKLAVAERFEHAALERDRLGALLGAARRRERLLPLLLAPYVLAAFTREGAWDVAAVSYGMLVGSAHALAAGDVEAAAARLREAHPPIARPSRPGEATHIEETELLAQWLAREGTRILSFEGPLPLAARIGGALAYRVPGRQGENELDTDSARVLD